MFENLRKKFFFFKISPSLYITNYLFQKILRIDSRCNFSKHYTSKVLYPQNISFERNSYKTLKSFFGSGGCYFNAANGIKIGKGTFWSVNVVIISETYDVSNNFKASVITKPVSIGEKCWIGANVVIMPEVTIGSNVVIGAGSIVTKSFPNNCVIAGNPAEMIRELNVKN